MPTPPNLYAEKVFAEHPSALWALDDKADFISLVPEFSSSPLSQWQTLNIHSLEYSEGSNSERLPVQDGNLLNMYLENTVPESGNVLTAATIALANIANLSSSSIDTDIGSLTVSLNFKSESSNVAAVQVGYYYVDPQTAESVSDTKIFSYSTPSEWSYMAKTFNVPIVNSFVTAFVNILYMYEDGKTYEDFPCSINGFAVAQASENFAAASSGAKVVQIPDNINIVDTDGVVAGAYGLQDTPGYYIVKGYNLLAKGGGIPMVFGGQGSVKILPNNDRPSLIIPGYGFMNSSGQYSDITAEFWFRGRSNTASYRKIFGPIKSDDGLYINGNFFTLKIGQYSSSFFVSEWNRPMLLDVRVSAKSADLLINGEQTCAIQLDPQNVSYANPLSNLGKDQDWVGFFSSADISNFEIDCVGIYKYRVPEVVAKRRFIYGQGVSAPQLLDSSLSGENVLIDYSVANYGNQISYPATRSWMSAVSDNIRITDEFIASPEAITPIVKLKDQQESDWLQSCYVANTESSESRAFVSMKSNDNTAGYILFDSMNPIRQPIAAFYGIFKAAGSSEEEILMKIDDPITGNYLLCTIQDAVIRYKFKYGYSSEVVLEEISNIAQSIPFAIGVDMYRFAENYGGNLSSFFGNTSRLKVYVAGYKDYNNTFSGKIYNVGFLTKRNLAKTSGLFTDAGIPEVLSETFYEYFLNFSEDPDLQIDFDHDGGYYDTLLTQWIEGATAYDGGDPQSFVSGAIIDYISSYTLMPKIQFDTISLDVSSDSYWEDYVPLSSLGKYFYNTVGIQEYGLSSMQFNMSYPRSPLIVDGTYFTDDEPARAYVSFEYLAYDSSPSNIFVEEIVPLPESGVVDPGNDFLYKRYEVVDGTVIYPPSGVDFTNLTMGIHIELQTPKSIKAPIKISSLSVSGQTFNSRGSNPIGTRGGKDIYPYTKYGTYFNYNLKNPVKIGKSSTPYLYLTDNTGIRLCETSSSYSINTGISIPINNSLAENFYVGGAQLFMNYQEDAFPSDPMQIFEISSGTKTTKFFVVAHNDSGSRGRIFAIDSTTGIYDQNVGMYINGTLSYTPVLEPKTWTTLGIQFPQPVDLSSTVGAIRLTGPMLFNNISYFRIGSNSTFTTVKYQKWNQILDTFDYWSYLLGEDTSGNLASGFEKLFWQNVLVQPSETTLSLNLSQLYKSYMGNNRISTNSNSRRVVIGNYKYSVYKNTAWQSSVVSVV